ncbi:MAG: MarR family transcriptional regulator [Micavibrio sp.]|nr:MarR family transcriptional regulator [Micavibrio sp.]
MKAENDDSQVRQAMVLAGDLRAVLGKVMRRLREQSSAGDYTMSQKSALMRLEREGPATVTALAQAAGVRSQSMGATLAALESAGMIKGAADPSDGRQTIWSVTAECQKIINDTRAAREDWLFRVLQKEFTAVERDALLKATALLKRIADV